MAHGRFGAQALAPLVYNGATIVGGLLSGSVEGLAKINFDIPAVGKRLDKSHFPVIQILIDHRQSSQYIKDGAGARDSFS